MKNSLFKFFRKYWLSFILSILMVLGIILSYKYADLYQRDTGMMSFDLATFYILLGLPIYSLMYGCLSYVKSRKIWVPQLILFATTFMYFFSVRSTSEVLIDILLFSMYPVMFSLIGTFITAFIYYIVKSIKED